MITFMLLGVLSLAQPHFVVYKGMTKGSDNINTSMIANTDTLFTN